MNSSKIITYAPKDEPPSEMGSLRRGLWFYTHKLGMEFTLTLVLSLIFQVAMASFVGLHGLGVVPVLNNLARVQPLLSIVITVLIWSVLQVILLAELAQIIWLEEFDRLKVRLMTGSFWWWIILGFLIISILIDVFLLFLALTGTDNWQDAVQGATRSLLSELVIGLFMLVNVLTLLRCASVMKTSSHEEIRRKVEERLQAQAEEMLLNAGDATRDSAKRIWGTLAVDPNQFLPIQQGVINMIYQQHPDLLPANIGGNTWAYDFNGNQLAALPPDVHQALLQHRTRVATRKLDTNENEHLWKLPPQNVAELIGYNMETYGEPTVVDATEPAQPRYATRRVNLPQENFVNTSKNSSNLLTAGNDLSVLENLTKPQLNEFRKYLRRVYQELHGESFVSDGESGGILDQFEPYEIQTYLKQWGK